MNDGREEAGFPAIRLVFQLDRAENPRLYDDLARFRKGARRVNRLRLLAHEGLRLQHDQWPAVAVVEDRARKGSHDESSITNGVFEPGIST